MWPPLTTFLCKSLPPALRQSAEKYCWPIRMLYVDSGYLPADHPRTFDIKWVSHRQGSGTSAPLLRPAYVCAEGKLPLIHIGGGPDQPHTHQVEETGEVYRPHFVCYSLSGWGQDTAAALRSFMYGQSRWYFGVMRSPSVSDIAFYRRTTCSSPPLLCN
jgi:hypothetical protein